MNSKQVLTTTTVITISVQNAKESGWEYGKRLTQLVADTKEDYYCVYSTNLLQTASSDGRLTTTIVMEVESEFEKVLEEEEIW